MKFTFVLQLPLSYQSTVSTRAFPRILSRREAHGAVRRVSALESDWAKPSSTAGLPPCALRPSADWAGICPGAMQSEWGAEKVPGREGAWQTEAWHGQAPTRVTRWPYGICLTMKQGLETLPPETLMYQRTTCRPVSGLGAGRAMEGCRQTSKCD